MNKKKLVRILIFIIIACIALARDYEDYELFIKGKNAYEKGEYKDAERYFDMLMRTYSRSLILKNNYANYYIGSNYNKLGDLKKAVYYLEAAVFSYNTPIFTRTSFDKKNRYYMLRDFELGEIFNKIGDREKATTYYRRLDYGVSTIATRGYEKKGLEAIKKKGDLNDKYYNIKFNYDFSNIKDFNIQTLIPIGNYFISMKEYDRAVKLYDAMLSSMRLKLAERERIKLEILKTLLRWKKYDEVISRGQAYQEGPVSDPYHYYMGRAYQESGMLVKCMEEYYKVGHGSYYERARLRIAGILYSIKRYQEVIDICSTLEHKNMFSDMMLTNSYLMLGKKKEFKKSTEDFIVKYPNIYYGMVFSYIKDNEKIHLENYGSILKMGMVLDKFINGLGQFPMSSIRESSLMEAKQLSQVAKLEYEELIKIEIENSSFSKFRSLENGYLITQILEAGRFYELAYRNSMYYRKEFFGYYDTVQYCYPRYYKDIVDAKSKKYDVPEVLLYTIMKNESGFNQEYISDDSRIGLMAVEYRSQYDIDRLLSDPEYNIDTGAKRMKEILNSAKGNYIKTLIIYKYGTEYFNGLKITKDNDIDLDAITDPQERHDLQSIILAYMMYSKLYK